MLRAAFTEPLASSELIKALAAKALSPAALRLLALVAEQPLTVSAATRALSRALPCATSTAWLAVRRLRELGLIRNGAAEPVELTEAGRLLLSALEGLP